MKYRKIILISSLLSLFLINNHIFGQSKSKEALGNALVESILSKNINSFKSLLLPQKVVFKLLEKRKIIKAFSILYSDVNLCTISFKNYIFLLNYLLFGNLNLLSKLLK